MEERKDYRNLLLALLMFLVITMSVGYAVLNNRLTVSGTATIADAKWDVKIISIEETSKSISGTEQTPTTGVGEQIGTTSASVITGSTTASFNVQLNAPGDYAEFTVTVKNLGTISATLDALELVQDSTPTEITYTVTPANADGAVALATGESETFVIKVLWTQNSDVPAETEKTATLTLDYIQSFNE